MNTNIEALQILTQELILEEKYLKITEDRFKMVVQNLPDIIIILNKHGVILYTNKIIKYILGYTDREILGRNISEFVYAEDVLIWTKTFGNLIEGSKSLRIRFIDKKTNTKKVRVSFSICNTLNEIMYFGIISEIKEREDDTRDVKKEINNILGT